MINLCLPMRVINITQHSGGSYSHPNYCLDMAGSDTGIDIAYALGDYWKCISGPWGSNTYYFTATDAVGHPVKVHCADNVNRIVTVAMTHANFYFVKRPIIGKVYSNGDGLYEEGTYGKATGNHIHYEVAEGLQYGKYYDSSMGVYRMHNELKPESVCYICDSFSTVKSTGGVSFRHCPGIYSEDIYMEMKTGMNWFEYGSIQLTAYLKPDNYKFGLFNADRPTVLPKIDDNSVMFIEKCGNDFFQMKLDQADPYGTVYGPRVCVNGPIDQPYMQPNRYLYYRIDKDGTVSFGDYTGNYIDPTWLKQSVQMVCSPQMIFCKDWKYPKYAPMAGGPGILAAPYYQAYFGRTKDGKFFSGKTLGRLSAKTVWAYFQEKFGVTDMAFMDGGSVEGRPGSAQQMYWDSKKGEMVWVGATENRAVRDILGFYKPIEEDGVIVAPDPVEPEKPEEPETDDKDKQIEELSLEVELLKTKLKKIKEIVNDGI